MEEKLRSTHPSCSFTQKHTEHLCKIIYVCRMCRIGQREAEFEAENVVSGRQLWHETEAVFKSVSPVAVAPSRWPWWKRTGDGGDERRSLHFPLSAAWFSARRRTERAWPRSHPEEILFSWEISETKWLSGNTHRWQKKLICRFETLLWWITFKSLIFSLKQISDWSFCVRTALRNTCKCYSVLIWATWRSWIELQYLQ